jgi:hypothetical protein
MKDSSEYTARLKKLCNRLKREKGAASVMGDEEPADALTELVRACLTAGATEAKAQAALNKFNSYFVDFNELRVCRPEEMAEVLGNQFPAAKDIAVQILGLLNQIFARRDTLSLVDLAASGKREAKVFLESLEGITPYVVARVMLFSLSGHAFPLHEQMVAMLRGEEVIDSAAPLDDIQGFLERQIPAKNLIKTYRLLRRHADNYRPGPQKEKKKRPSRAKSDAGEKKDTPT